MHSQKPISSNPEIQLQVYNIIPVQITYAGYMDFTEIRDKSKQTSLFFEEEKLPFSDRVNSTAIQNVAWGPGGAHGSEGQEGTAATALLWDVGAHSGGTEWHSGKDGTSSSYLAPITGPKPGARGYMHQWFITPLNIDGAMAILDMAFCLFFLSSLLFSLLGCEFLGSGIFY